MARTIADNATAARQPRPVPGHRLALAPLFLVSLGAIGYEIALTRFFAVSEWSDYGYWVISIAMAGFALSGVALALTRDAAARHGPALLAALPPLLILAAAGGFTLAALNPFNPLQLQNPVTWTDQIWNIAGNYAALLPFFFLAGLFVSLSFVLNPGRAGAVYAADLGGAGAGAALIMALMFIVHPFRLVAVLLLPLALATPLRRRRLVPTAAALLAAEALLLFGPQPHGNDFKPIYAPLHTEGARIVAQRLSPAGVYTLLDDFTERVDTDISNDAAMLNLSGPPRGFGLYRDGERIATLPRHPLTPHDPDLGYAAAALDALPYALLPHPRALLIGASGGFRAAEARRLGAAHVLALEPEPVLLGALRHGLGPSPPLPADPAMRILGANPRAAVRTGARFDLIDISGDFLAAAPANEAAFTAEALADDLRALTPGGIVSIPVSIRDFPVYALRLLATAREALRQAGIAAPESHALLYRSAWNARLLLSNRPFGAERIAAARRFCDQRSFDLSWYPGIDVTAARATIYNDLPAVSFADGATTAAGPDDSVADEAAAMLDGRSTPSAAAFNLAPVTLDRPAFFATLRLAQLGTLLRRLEVLPQAEIGALINLAVLAQAALIALLVLLLPLAAPARLRPAQGGFAWTLLYFPALALGFLFIEIALIQQATFWLNDRASAFALVLTGMLVFSGLGSACTGMASFPRKREPMPRARWVPAVAGTTVERCRSTGSLPFIALTVCVWTAAILLFLPHLMLATLNAPWAIRALLVLAITAPVSFALGMPFPLGLARVGQGGALPWAWGLNGAFSVLATPLANLIARDFGFSRVLLCAAVLYVVAAACFPAMRRRSEWLHQPARLPGAD